MSSTLKGSPTFFLQPSAELMAFAKRQIRNVSPYLGTERRMERREFVVLPVNALSIDEALRPLGPPLAMVTHSLSLWGIGLIHEHPLSHDLLALRLVVQGDEELVVGAVHWRKSLGPFNMCGCEVIARLDQFPTAPFGESRNR
jgi:hypothetical protein